jgi:nucleotide-binding universal stress UspA family protein
VSYATVMVHVDVGNGADARVRLAAALADRFAADLIGVSACLLPPYPAESAYFVTRDVIEQERRDIETLLVRAETAFRAAAGADRRRIEWRAAIEPPDTYLATQARAADLVIVGRRAGAVDGARVPDPGGIALRAGRPVLVVPPDVDTLAGERVVVGWKDTREARRAIRDALPLLERAGAVTLVEICDEPSVAEGRQHLEDVARYLARHKVKVGAKIATAPDGRVADELIRLAKADNADLIVAGAYGHSRLGEWVFGGATRNLLAASPVCCLLAH